MKKILNYISVFLFFAFILMFAVSTVLFRNTGSAKDKIREGDTVQKQLQKLYKQPFFRSGTISDHFYSTVMVGSGQNRLGSIYVDENRLIEIFDKTDEKRINKRGRIYQQL